MLDWKDDYRTGSDSIDYEHETLIVAINHLYYQAISSGGDKIIPALGEIHALIEAHFALEEKIMRDQNYPGYADHKQDHDRLLDEILDIMDDAEAENLMAAGPRLAERLGAWFGIHFSTFDRQLHGQV